MEDFTVYQEFSIYVSEDEKGVRFQAHIDLKEKDSLIAFVAREFRDQSQKIMDTAREKFEQYHGYKPTTH